MKTIIKTESLSKSFGKKHVIKNLNLEIKEGEIFGLIGPNGAGKTTTILLMNGFYRPTAGKIFINEVDVTIDEIAHKNSLGYLPDKTGFYELMSARENLKFFASLYNLPKKEIENRVDELLEYVSLTQAADVQVKKFSMGMVQRLGLAKALIHEPKILIMDEPQSGLDFEGIELLRQLIERLASEGKTVIFSSHQLTEILKLCTSIGVLFQGELIYQGSLEGLLNQMRHEYHKFEITGQFDSSKLMSLDNIAVLKNLREKVMVMCTYDATDFKGVLGEADIQIDSLTELEATEEELFLHYYYQHQKQMEVK